jgi:membrane-associated phospholipid phosphatase
MPGLNGTDRLLVGYTLGVAALIAVAALSDTPEPSRLPLASLHLAIAGFAMVLARLDAGPASKGWRWLHRWLPVLALPWLYDAAGRLRHLLVAHDLDAWIVRADDWLFPGRWYLAGARWPLPALELAHAVYFSYYLLLFVPALVVERRGHLERSQVDRYLGALTATLLAHYALNFLLPVAGPLADRALGMPRGALFLPLMDAIYFAFDRGGLAFPSTHVAASVVAGWFAGRRFFPNAGRRYALWVAAIAASTVVCGYHYPIDVVAGLLTGAAGVAVARRRESPPRAAGAARR